MTASAAHWATCAVLPFVLTPIAFVFTRIVEWVPGTFHLRHSDRVPGCTGFVLPRMEVRCRFPESGPGYRVNLRWLHLSAGTVFDLHKPTPFRGCLVLPNATKVNPHCSLPPGAESTFLDRIREEVCGPSNKRKPNHLPCRRRRDPYPQ